MASDYAELRENAIQVIRRRLKDITREMVEDRRMNPTTFAELQAIQALCELESLTWSPNEE